MNIILNQQREQSVRKSETCLLTPDNAKSGLLKQGGFPPVHEKVIYSLKEVGVGVKQQHDHVGLTGYG